MCRIKKACLLFLGFFASFHCSIKVGQALAICSVGLYTTYLPLNLLYQEWLNFVCDDYTIIFCMNSIICVCLCVCTKACVCLSVCEGHRSIFNILIHSPPYTLKQNLSWRLKLGRTWQFGKAG